MKREYKPLDLKRVKTYSIKERKSKVQVGDFAKPHVPGASFRQFIDALPDILAVQSFRSVVRAMQRARRQHKVIILGMGAHPIKVGLSPLVIQLMEAGFVQCLATNGAGIIHDLELALAGQTSEDVDESLAGGEFGMALETSTLLNEYIRTGVKSGLGIGEAVGRGILEGDYPFKKYSLLAAGARLGIPITIHVALGTDIIHMHPSADGAAVGEGTLRDFYKLAAVVAHLHQGVYLNIGSAVILPEVFLKALTLARNLGHVVEEFTTVNLDFIHHYRPATNVVKRPTRKSGQGYTLIGHHEIMLPLLTAALLEEPEHTPSQDAD